MTDQESEVKTMKTEVKDQMKESKFYLMDYP